MIRNYGNLITILEKSLQIKNNLLNLLKLVTAADGKMKLDYTFSGEKTRKHTDASTGAEDRLYLGGVEYKDGKAEAYYHAEGRVELKDGVHRFQYNLTDHLGDLMVQFEDKDDDGTITTESMTNDPQQLEILQRHYYYGLCMYLCS